MKENIEKFFTSEAFAVVGVSNSKGKFGTVVFNTFFERNLTVYPVNHKYDMFNGNRCYKSVTDLPKNVKSIVCVIPPNKTEKVVQECTKTEIKNVWMQPGSESLKAINLAAQHKISIIQNQCILMFLEPVKSYHSFHRWINKILGKYPK